MNMISGHTTGSQKRKAHRNFDDKIQYLIDHGRTTSSIDFNRRAPP